jgi:hypothetical protein
MFERPLRALLGLAALALAAAGAPRAARAAEPALPGGFSAVGEIRLGGADGERSWTNGNFGKLGFGGGSDGDFRLKPRLAQGELIWQPRLGWAVSGTVVAGAQRGQEHAVDLIEAFATFKPMPLGATRVSARAGLMWPPVSLEHEGAAWTVADMITPSAINSWIGEEVKVVGAEATVSRGPLAATAAIFGFNDTAGTLIAFRGWALHDLKATAFGRQPLPPLNGFMAAGVQAPATRPAIELDDRAGFYGKLAWRPASAVMLEALYYDNRADPEAVTPSLQWGWRTRFLDVGARMQLAEHTKLLAQAMTGSTRMGYDEGYGIWVHTRFRAGYVRLSQGIGRATLTGRVDLFGTTDRGSEMGPQESEDGWAATAAAAWRLSPHVQLLIEALRVDSRRASRLRLGVDPHQTQNQLQAALRLSI